MQEDSRKSIRVRNYSIYLVAIVAPEPIADEVMAIKKEFADNYNSKKPLNSPPHFTLINPFNLPDDQFEIVVTPLSEFVLSQKKFSVQLSGFNAFPKHTIYIDIKKPNENLLVLHENLRLFVTERMRFLKKLIKKQFTPHMTVGYRDLSENNFDKAWPEFQKRKFEGAFEIDRIMLLRHNGKRWETFKEFPFGGSGS